MKISTIFYGVLPFIVTDILRLIILIAFPILALVAAVEDVSVSSRTHWAGIQSHRRWRSGWLDTGDEPRHEQADLE